MLLTVRAAISCTAGDGVPSSGRPVVNGGCRRDAVHFHRDFQRTFHESGLTRLLHLAADGLEYSNGWKENGGGLAFIGAPERYSFPRICQKIGQADEEHEIASRSWLRRQWGLHLLPLRASPTDAGAALELRFAKMSGAAR
jgi:hypothetical protein